MPPTKDAAATDFDTQATTSSTLLVPKTTRTARRSQRLRTDHQNRVRQERAACPAESTQAVRSVPGQVGEKARRGGSNAQAADPKGSSCIRRLRSSRTVARPRETPIPPKRSKGEPAQVRGVLEGELGWGLNDLCSAMECSKATNFVMARGTPGS